tara:strand:- start:81 stop:2141 length:2061 start_codon:yes stop_codon:yes gene_type:complete
MACKPMPPNPDIDDLAKAIECLQQEIAGLEGSINNATSAAERFSGQIGVSNDLLGDMRKKFVGINKANLEFVRSTGQQYKLAEQLAESYKKTSLQIGLSVDRTRDLSKEFKGAVAMVSRFGGDMNDVQEIYNSFADNSGRVRILGKEEVANIYKLGEATKLFGTKASDLYETLDLMGVSNLDATARMNELIVESQQVALNSSKVMNVLADNMGQMQSYSFKGGVKGMTEMAKQAVKMRIDVNSILGMADKFYQPEAAIEAAANLQMLGGDIAEAFGDPFETMYLARNKPEELAKRLQDMTENMMTFNAETKEYEFPAEVRMQLKAAGDQLGIDVGKMTEMARQTSKMKDVKMKLNMAGNLTDDKMIEGISNLARMEDGEFKVDFRDESGEKITKSIDQLTKGEAEMVLKAPKNEEDYMDKMLYEAQTTNQRLEFVEDAFKFEFLENVDVYQAMEDATQKSIVTFGEELSEGVKHVFEGFDQGYYENMLAGLAGFDSLKKFDQAMSDMIEGFSDLYTQQPIIGEEVIINSDGLIQILGGSPNTTQNGQGNTTVSQSDKERCEDKTGHVWDGTNCKDSTGTIVPLETGGIVTEPITALLGEGKEYEAVMPLSDLKKFIGNNNSSKTEHKVGGTITLNINGADVPQDLKNQFTEALMNKIVQKNMAGNGLENGGTSKGGIDTFKDMQLT